MLLRLIIIFHLSAFLIACEPIKKLTNKFKSQPEQKEQTLEPAASENEAPAEAAAPAEQKCEDGSSPQVVTGSCEGVWRVSEAEGKTSCQFDWGPKIKCPEGTKSLNYEAVCYGTTEKPLGAGQTAKTANDCSQFFGEYPVSPAYTLLCCPN